VLGAAARKIIDLSQRGVPFEVVPGVNGRQRGVRLWGIPLTHGAAPRVCVLVSGHRPYGSESWTAALARTGDERHLTWECGDRHHLRAGDGERAGPGDPGGRGLRRIGRIAAHRGRHAGRLERGSSCGKCGAAIVFIG